MAWCKSAIYRYLVGERIIDARANSRAAYWGNLQAKAHLPEIQAIIRQEVYRDTIRVVRAAGGGIRIIPTDGSTVEESEPAPRAVFEQDHTIRSDPALCIRRSTS
jgi:hypothetical protein